MDYKVSYGKWDLGGIEVTQRVSVRMDAGEFLALNAAIACQRRLHPRKGGIQCLRLGSNAVGRATAAFAVDWMGRTPRFKDDRQTDVRVTLTGWDGIFPPGEFDRGDERIFRLRKRGLIYAGAVPYGLSEDMSGMGEPWIHEERLDGERRFVWFEARHLYAFGLLCAKRGISSRTLNG